MRKVKDTWIKFLSICYAFILTTLGKAVVNMILLTCKWQIEGLDHFLQAASKGRCILVLWHNRLAITSFILKKYAPHFSYVAVVSKSRDGRLINALVRSYKKGATIQVPHDSRHEALRLIIKEIEKGDRVIVFTPDGPRGPKYAIKPGVALAAKMSGASVVPFTWKADRMWQFKTWDALQLPKPFSTISIAFGPAANYDKKSDLNEVQQSIQQALSEGPAHASSPA